MPTITFPLEIEITILELLAEDYEGHWALKSCSLVCQAFLPICRKHIFRNIVLGLPPIIHAFQRLLRETPEIADYIRKLDYTIQETDLASPSIQETLKQISRLEFLSVRDDNLYRPGWSNYSIRPALLRLLHLPTLTHFKLNNINSFPISDLIPCVNLKYLDINYVKMEAGNTFPATLPEHSIQLNEFIAGPGACYAVKKLSTARRPDGQPIIDFGSLSKITVDMDLFTEVPQELFRRCHSLTNVHISYWNSRPVRPCLADMLRPSMQTLKHIHFVLDIDDDDDSSTLFSIPSEFEEMCTKISIETVTIEVHMDVNNHGGDDWCRFDEVFTTPGWFSLKRFSLCINYLAANYELEEVLRNLPETQFRRLSSSNSVSFDFKVISKYRNNN